MTAAKSVSDEANINFSEFDRQLIAALLAHPRATGRQIAAALSASEAAVSRRLGRLLRSGRVHTTASVDVLATGQGTPVFIRLGCRSGTALEVAEVLADREQVRMVSVLSGSTNVLAEAVVADRDGLLLLTQVTLPAITGVESCHAEVILRRFVTGATWDPGVLPLAATRDLLAHRPDRWEHVHPTAPAAPMSALDLELAALLGADGRLGWRELGRLAGVMESTARRRTEAMFASGALKLRTVVEPQALGLSVSAFLWFRVHPRQVQAVSEALAGHPAVMLLCSAAGESNLCSEVALARYEDLDAFLRDTLGAIPGLREVDVTLSLRTLKRAGMRT